MADEIKADYDQLEQIAQRFTSESEAISEMLQMVKASAEKLADGGWIGRGSEAFVNEMSDEILPATMRLQNALAEAGSKTAEIAKTLQQAEEEASGLFRV